MVGKGRRVLLTQEEHRVVPVAFVVENPLLRSLVMQSPIFLSTLMCCLQRGESLRETPAWTTG